MKSATLTTNGEQRGLWHQWLWVSVAALAMGVLLVAVLLAWFQHVRSMQNGRMSYAILRGDPDEIRDLIRRGANPNGTAEMYVPGDPPRRVGGIRFLTLALLNHKISAVRALVEAGADIHVRDKVWGSSALEIAEKGGQGNLLR